MGPTLGRGRVGEYVMTLPCLYASVVHKGGGEANDSAVLAKGTAQMQPLLYSTHNLPEVILKMVHRRFCTK